MTSSDAAPPDSRADDAATGLDVMQDRVRLSRRRYGFDKGPAVALLDACAELGELSGALLKETGYSASGGTPLSSSVRIRAEYGDVLFAVLGFADAAGISAHDALSAALVDYESRFASRAPQEERTDHG
ncbi:nucleotide pyrophosphohydrolase [Saccharothrix deserti]|uniref:nucleotide pyrophosphohydrolase n=1 Tax=Saccharothrix deserti TaxID=2593674 RepID=UPI00131B8A04|nr:nucleotide pyrophosphohydrolase [Saccharothrix deserti]